MMALLGIAYTRRRQSQPRQLHSCAPQACGVVPGTPMLRFLILFVLIRVGLFGLEVLHPVQQYGVANWVMLRFSLICRLKSLARISLNLPLCWCEVSTRCSQ